MELLHQVKARLGAPLRCGLRPSGFVPGFGFFGFGVGVVFAGVVGSTLARAYAKNAKLPTNGV